LKNLNCTFNKENTMIHKFIHLASLTIAVFWFTGCINNNDTDLSDGTAEEVSQEIVDMGNAFEMNDFGFLAKSAADTVFVSGQIIKEPWSFQNKWWVRTIEVQINDRTVEKIDSVQFLDETGNNEQFPGWKTTSGWVHHRHVERIGLQNEHNVDFTMTVTLQKGKDTTGTWNGSIQGILNGSKISSSEISEVVRERGQGFWKFPSSGNVFIDRPLRTINIDFTGNGSASACITRKRDGKTTDITITINT